MSFTVHHGGRDDAEQAAEWVVRLAGDSVDADTLAAFDAWLAASPARAAAYDAALAVWSLPVEQAPAQAKRPASRSFSRNGRFALGGGLAAAAAVTAVVLFATASRPERYVTGPGQTRDIALSDGSKVALNASSTLEVRWRKGERSVSLPQGEASFDVAKDAARPFVIRSGERSVRVVGTAFDVDARGDAMAVTVSRGMVEVRASATAEPVRLLRGDRLRFAGLQSTAQLSKVNPDEADSWRKGRLIYHGAELNEVVQAVNAQFGPPSVRVTPAASRLKFSGVLMLDERDAVMRRLAAALPLTYSSASGGAVLDVAKTAAP